MRVARAIGARLSAISQITCPSVNEAQFEPIMELRVERVSNEFAEFVLEIDGVSK